LKWQPVIVTERRCVAGLVGMVQIRFITYHGRIAGSHNTMMISCGPVDIMMDTECGSPDKSSADVNLAAF
jgi:hypothetical protein